MDVEEEFAASLAAGVEQVLADVLLQAAVEDAVGGSGKELYTYLDRSRPYGQQRVWVRARVENGRPVEIECEDRETAV